MSSPKDLYIAGAGGLGRELLAWLRQSPDCGRVWEPKGYLDDDPEARGRDLPLPLVGSVDGFSPGPDSMVVLGLGNSEPRKDVVEKLEAKGVDFLTFVHPSVNIGERVTIGRGTVICPGCVLTCDISVGEFCFFNLKVTVGHDVSLDSFVSISSQVDLCGGVVVEDGVWFGSGARVIPCKRIRKKARVGAGAVVIRDVPAGITVFGNPAKRI